MRRAFDARVHEIRPAAIRERDELLERFTRQDRKIRSAHEDERVRREAAQSRLEACRHRCSVGSQLVCDCERGTVVRALRCDHDDTTDARRVAQRRKRARDERRSGDRNEALVRRARCER